MLPAADPVVVDMVAGLGGLSGPESPKEIVFRFAYVSFTDVRLRGQGYRSDAASPQMPAIFAHAQYCPALTHFLN